MGKLGDSGLKNLPNMHSEDEWDFLDGPVAKTTRFNAGSTE